MASSREKILLLVKAAPNWSKKYKTYEVCTAGVTEEGEWRRLYPFSESVMREKNIRVWDWIEVDTEPPTNDNRSESRKIDESSIEIVGRINKRKNRRDLLNTISEPTLQVPLNEKRSLTVLKPEIVRFNIEERPPEPVQLTLEGTPFIKNPYGGAGLYYRWRCQEPCEFCDDRTHRMECFDWGANVLYTRYKDKAVAREKVTDMCYHRMKEEFDTWFALGTHSRYPFRRWMIVGLLWMKKE